MVQIPYGLSHTDSQSIQSIQDGMTTNVFYGDERLALQRNTISTWYLTNALGSVRTTLNDVGVPVATVNYDAWGVPETALLGALASPANCTVVAMGGYGRAGTGRDGEALPRVIHSRALPRRRIPCCIISMGIATW